MATDPKRKLKVINLFGTPGVGKSSIAAGVFWLMKAHHMSVEAVSEYAKYLVLSGRTWQLREEQVYLLAKQHHKQLIIERSGYEYAVTDSPLHLCQFYAPADYYASFESLVGEAADRFENINFFVTRDLSNGVFEERGRQQSRDEAIVVEQRMREFLARSGVTCTELPVDMLSPWRVLQHLGVDEPRMPDFRELGEGVPA